ncbi:MAG: archaeosortase/exosortase family protein [Bacteroidia bacterium]
MAVITFKNKITRFFVFAAALYLVWWLLDEFVVKPHTLVDEKLISLIIANAAFLLKLLGFTVYQSIEDGNIQLIGVDGAHPVWIGTPCNALTLFMFFALFVIAFPGSTKKKLWFIPLGIVIIHFTNVLRVIALVMINYYAPQYLIFNHTYTFTILVYGIIFCLWMWWVNTSLKEIKINEQKN